MFSIILGINLVFLLVLFPLFVNIGFTSVHFVALSFAGSLSRNLLKHFTELSSPYIDSFFGV